MQSEFISSSKIYESFISQPVFDKETKLTTNMNAKRRKIHVKLKMTISKYKVVSKAIYTI